MELTVSKWLTKTNFKKTKVSFHNCRFSIPNLSGRKQLFCKHPNNLPDENSLQSTQQHSFFQQNGLGLSAAFLFDSENVLV